MTPRPPHEPIAVRCPECAAPLRVADERAQLVVCGNCDSRLELTGPMRDTLTMLGDPKVKRVRYDLDIAQKARWKGLVYEVVARMCFTEEGSMEYATRVYVLYHPRRPLLYLDEYDHAFGLTHKVHEMPRQPPTSLKSGSKMQTYDGKKWLVDEVVVRTLVHVDGCLPWVARIGDRVRAWECSGAGGAVYEIEVTEGEIEYSTGRQLNAADVRRLLPGVKVRVEAPAVSPALKKRQAMLTMVAGLLSLLLNASLAFYAQRSGDKVHSEVFSASQVTSEVTSASFDLSGDKLVRVDLWSPDLDNAWMVVDVALVQDGDEVVHVTDADISYYHGVEGGESWSEGSRSESILLSGIRPGVYRLHLRAVSNRGETETARGSQHRLVASVTDGAHSAGAPFFGIMLGIALMVASFVWFKKISEDE